MTPHWLTSRAAVRRIICNPIEVQPLQEKSSKAMSS
jgi:hypothetical protein